MEQVVTAASILFGFLFAGFWWALDRELKFPPDQRHFKPAYALLLSTMAERKALAALMVRLVGLWLLLGSRGLANAFARLRG